MRLRLAALVVLLALPAAAAHAGVERERVGPVEVELVWVEEAGVRPVAGVVPGGRAALRVEVAALAEGAWDLVVAEARGADFDADRPAVARHVTRGGPEGEVRLPFTAPEAAWTRPALVVDVQVFSSEAHALAATATLGRVGAVAPAWAVWSLTNLWLLELAFLAVVAVAAWALARRAA